MKWRGRESSRNVEDRRGGGYKTIGGGLGIGGLIVIGIIYLLGGDPSVLIDQVQIGSGQEQVLSPEQQQQQDELAQFVSVVLKDTEDVWHEVFREQLDGVYTEPTLVLFSRAVQSACGSASAATGPFYCPGDQKLYIDLTFYQELKDRFGAPGDFAMAYVVAHEVGHHVQNLLGITDQIDAQRGRLSQEEYNKLSVKLELQADYLAGVWANHADEMKQILEQGDIEEALNAANAIGDDRLQEQIQGYVVPESFTHGTSEQRMRWFRKGYESGLIKEGNTFNTPVL